MGIADSNEAKYWPEFYGLYYAEHISIALLRCYYLSDIETFNEELDQWELCRGAKYWQEYFNGSNVQSFNVMISVVQHFAPNSYGCEHMLCLGCSR